MLVIRDGVEGDLPRVLVLVRELAEYEKTVAPRWATWRPNFSAYDVVIQTCNDINGGPSWPREIQLALEDYVARGGGLYVWHSGNNAFATWPAFASETPAAPANDAEADSKLDIIVTGEREKRPSDPKLVAPLIDTLAAGNWLRTTR